jgi:hypothetical protein
MKTIRVGNKLLVIHKEIQPIIHQEFQPVITTEIQPVINEEIQPVVFSEMDPNIEETIQQLNRSANNTTNEFIPNYEKEKGILGSHLEIIPYIEKVEQHTSINKVVPSVQRETKTILQRVYVPFIQFRDGSIHPYEKQSIKNLYPYGKQTIGATQEIMEGIIAVNFVSLEQNISYPMACKKTDIFANIEKKLYDEYPKLKSKNLYFIASGNYVNRSLTFEQNKIQSGSTILIKENELKDSYKKK